MVTIRTTSLTFNNSMFSPHGVFMCFVWISEQTAIISLYSINRLVFITETDTVYSAVRTEALNQIQYKILLQMLLHVSPPLLLQRSRSSEHVEAFVIQFCTIHIYVCVTGRDSLVGIATRYGLDSPGSYPGGGEIFRTRPDLPWGLPSL